MPEEAKSLLHLTQYHLRKWFKSHGGKEKSGLEKPYLSDEKKGEQTQWVQDMLEWVQQQNFYAGFIPPVATIV